MNHTHAQVERPSLPCNVARVPRLRGHQRIANERDGGRQVCEDVLVFRVLDSDAAVPRVPRAGWSSFVAAFDVFGVLRAHGEDVCDPELGVVAQRQRCRQAAEREKVKVSDCEGHTRVQAQIAHKGPNARTRKRCYSHSLPDVKVVRDGIVVWRVHCPCPARPRSTTRAREDDRKKGWM